MVIPIGTTTNFVLSIDFNTDAAESRDTSCSPLRPPNKIPTRIFAINIQSGRDGLPTSIAELVHVRHESGRPRRERSVGLCVTGDRSPMTSFTYSVELEAGRRKLFCVPSYVQVTRSLASNLNEETSSNTLTPEGNSV
jgi:hypothetical protein